MEELAFAKISYLLIERFMEGVNGYFYERGQIMKERIKGFFSNKFVKIITLFIKMVIASVLYGCSAAVFVTVLLSTIVCGALFAIADAFIGHDLSDVMFGKALKFLKVKIVNEE